jgi:hypothetical protein
VTAPHSTPAEARMALSYVTSDGHSHTGRCADAEDDADSCDSIHAVSPIYRMLGTVYLVPSKNP